MLRMQWRFSVEGHWCHSGALWDNIQMMIVNNITCSTWQMYPGTVHLWEEAWCAAELLLLFKTQSTIDNDFGYARVKTEKGETSVCAADQPTQLSESVCRKLEVGLVYTRADQRNTYRCFDSSTVIINTLFSPFFSTTTESGWLVGNWCFFSGWILIP